MHSLCIGTAKRADRVGASPLRRALIFMAWLFLLPCPDSFANNGAMELSLEDAEGKVLYSAPINNGGIFAIRYRHSVALSPVTDYFLVKEGSIWLDRTVYEDFGAGLPHMPEEGQVMRALNGKISISGYDRKLGSFQLRVGRVADHILLLKPANSQDSQTWRELPLDRIARPGSAITFTVRQAAP